MNTGWLFRIEWANPYTNPPEGAPCILAEIFAPDALNGSPPPELLSIPITPGGGYSISIRAIWPPPRQLSVEMLARVRRKRLDRRARAKMPLFADEFIRQEMAKKPDYYAGVTDPSIEARRQSTQEQEQAERERLWAQPNILLVYGAEPEACQLRAAKIRQEFLERQACVRRKYKPENT